MDLVAFLDDPDPVGAFVAVLERLNDADRMHFASDARVPQRGEGERRARSDQARRAERAFDDLRHDGSVGDGYGSWYFDPDGHGHDSAWLNVCGLIGEAAAALAARDQERVTLIACYLQDLG